MTMEFAWLLDAAELRPGTLDIRRSLLQVPTYCTACSLGWLKKLRVFAASEAYWLACPGIRLFRSQGALVLMVERPGWMLTSRIARAATTPRTKLYAAKKRLSEELLK